MFNVNESVVESVLKLFDKEKGTVNEDIANIQKWMKNQPHLPEVLDERSILNFLILNKFSIEKTKQKIDMYYTVRTKLDDVYEHMNPNFSHMREFREIIYFVPHPQLLDLRRVFFCKIRNPDLADKLDPYNMLRCMVSVHEIRMREDVMYGEIFVVDCSNVPLSYYLKLNPTIIFKCMAVIYGKIFSFRLKSFYVINFPSFGEKVISIAKKIIKPKVFERIHFSSGSGILRQELPEDFLPEDFGGKSTCLEKLQEMLNCEYENHQKLFDYLDELRVDESLRPEQLKNNELLGFYGNFKKLSID